MDSRGYVRGLTRTRPPVIHRWCMGAIVGRRFVWELGDGTSHTRDSQHTSSGFVHNDLGNPALWLCERVTPRNGKTRGCVARRRTYGTDLDEASHVTDHSPLACR